MCVLSIKVPIRKKSGNLFNDPRFLVWKNVFANGKGELGSIPDRIIPKILKWYLLPTCLPLSNIRYVSRGKWSNPGKWVASSSTPRCSSCWKREPLGHPRLRLPILFTYMGSFATHLGYETPLTHCLQMIIYEKSVFPFPFLIFFLGSYFRVKGFAFSSIAGDSTFNSVIEFCSVKLNLFWSETHNGPFPFLYQRPPVYFVWLVIFFYAFSPPQKAIPLTL